MEFRFDEIIKKLDEVGDKLREIRRYNARTALLVIILWGVGLPLIFMASIIYAATRS